MIKATRSIPPDGVSERDSSGIVAIQGLVARMFSLEVEELTTSRRERIVTIPRQIAMYLAKRETQASLMEIGVHFGGKHHSTVLHAIDRIEELRRVDPAMNTAIEMLQRNLKSGYSRRDASAVDRG